MHTAYTCMRAMAECRPPSAKKAKRSAPVSRVTAQERAKHFKRTCMSVMEFFFASFASIVWILLE